MEALENAQLGGDDAGRLILYCATMKTKGEGIGVRCGCALGLCLLGALLLTGCPNPQTYGTPRTTPAGKVTHTIAPEAMTVKGTSSTSQTDPITGQEQSIEEDVSVTVPLFPTYQLRIGASDSVDIGIKVANLSSLGTDVKINPIRGTFDLAIDPGFQWFGINAGSESFNVFYGHLPLMLGFNFSRDTSLVLTPGVVYSWASATTDAGGEDSLLTSSGVAGRLGIGFEYRASSSFAIHPEVTTIRGLTGDFGDNGGTIIVFGFGFNIANIPDYSDIE